jgi:hypothetical protein
LIRETLNTSIGAAALAVDFATHPSKQTGWLKKAERRGSRLTSDGEKQIRKLNHQVESLLGEVTKPALSALGLAETPAPKPVRAAVRKPRRKVRRRRSTNRSVKLTVSTPASRAS